jgi:CHASE2 domain-containing sensor protein
VTARRTMLANASFSAGSAVFILAARDRLYPLFALESSLLLALIAGGLLLYAGSLVVAARRQPPDRRALLTAAVLDAGWVLGSAIVLIAAWAQLAPAARVLLIAAALVVEVFATLQFRVARSIAREVGR